MAMTMTVILTATAAIMLCTFFSFTQQIYKKKEHAALPVLTCTYFPLVPLRPERANIFIAQGIALGMPRHNADAL